MQFNRDEYLLLSRRGRVPHSSRAGPRHRPPSHRGGRTPRRRSKAARRLYAELVAWLAAVRDLRAVLGDGREDQYRRR